MIELPVLHDPERGVALSYVAADHRRGLAALWALDETLAGILRATRDPLVGQMRLTWWHGALCGLDQAMVPNQPVLAALAAHVIARGIAGAAIAGMIDGWEALLDSDPLDDEALSTHAEARGARLFALGAAVLGAAQTDHVVLGGRGWALIDLALHLRDGDAQRRCRAQAIPLLEAAMSVRWPRSVRPLGMLARLALIDARSGASDCRRQGSPARLMQMMAHALSGR